MNYPLLFVSRSDINSTRQRKRNSVALRYSLEHREQDSSGSKISRYLRVDLLRRDVEQRSILAAHEHARRATGKLRRPGLRGIATCDRKIVSINFNDRTRRDCRAPGGR